MKRLLTTFIFLLFVCFLSSPRITWVTESQEYSLRTHKPHHHIGPHKPPRSSPVHPFVLGLTRTVRRNAEVVDLPSIRVVTWWLRTEVVHTSLPGRSKDLTRVRDYFFTPSGVLPRCHTNDPQFRTTFYQRDVKYDLLYDRSLVCREAPISIQGIRKFSFKILTKKVSKPVSV